MKFNLESYNWKEISQFPFDSVMNILYSKFPVIDTNTINSELKEYIFRYSGHFVKLIASNDQEMIIKICNYLNTYFPNKSVKDSDISIIFV